MNERIRELATQADVWCDQNVAQGSPAYNNLWEHKFAELIVQECLDQLHVVDLTEDFDKGIAWSAVQIKKHFGIQS